MTTFKDLQAHLSLVQPDYYETILKHSSLILEEIGRTSKLEVASAIGMTPQVFTTAHKFIVAHHNINRG